MRPRDRARPRGYAWQAPVRRELTLQEAEDAARIAFDISDEIDDASVLDRCFISFFCNLRNGPVWGSAIDDVVNDVHRRLVAIEGPARLLRLAGMLVALVVVAGAGAFAMAARRVESNLLFARGARPRAVGGRAALEAILPCAAGAAVGLGLSFALVRGVGPNGALAGRATNEALWAAGVAWVASVVAIATVSTVSFLRQSEHHRSRLRFLGTLPWELALIALSLLILQRLRSGGAVVVDPALGTKAPSLLLFAFPIAFLAGAVALVARGVVLALRWARGRSSAWGTPAYLAVHRLAARSRLTLLLITAAGLCLGLFVQAQTVARSMGVTVDAKAGVYVGSDVQARIDSVNETPERFPLPLTRAVRRLQAGELRPAVPFDLLAIDTETFASTAFWDPAFSPEPLETLLDGLSGPSDETLPVVMASAPNAFPDSITIDRTTVPIEIVGRANAFPGMTSIRPLVVVDEQRLLDSFEGMPNPLTGANASDELWIRGDPAAARQALSELSFVPMTTADEVKDIPHRRCHRYRSRDERAGSRGPSRLRGDAHVPADTTAFRDRVVRPLAADGDAVLATPARDRHRGRRDARRRVRRRWCPGARGRPADDPAAGPDRGDPARTDRRRAGGRHHRHGAGVVARRVRRRMAHRTARPRGRPGPGDASCGLRRPRPGGSPSSPRAATTS
jgi:hypothetical protein